MVKGKKLYKSSAIKSIKIILVSIIVVLGVNIILKARLSEQFSKFDNSISQYFWFYPEDILLYVFMIFIPGLYYAFIRGVIFYENGLTVNKGFPFFNFYIPYDRIKSYEILEQRHLVSINLKESDEDLMLSIKDIDRAVAILDQNQIKGDLGSKTVIDYSNRRKLLLFFIVSGLFVFVWHYFSLTKYLMR